MKLSETQLEHLSRMIRADFDNIPTRYRSDIHRYDISMELIELATRLGLDELAEEMRSDLDFESTTDPNEDRENDSDYNNERESNFKNANR